jgi:hypothetical protein
MSTQKSNRFSLAGVMILVAAITPGLLLLRIGQSLNVFKSSRNATPGQHFIELISVYGGCILIPLIFVVLVLGVLDRQSNRHDVIQSPGFVACFVAAIALILPIGYFVVRVGSADRLNRSTELAVNFHNICGSFTHEAGSMIIGAWLALALAGCRRPGLSWIDRSGCLIGICIILTYLSTDVYYMLRPVLGL